MKVRDTCFQVIARFYAFLSLFSMCKKCRKLKIARLSEIFWGSFWRTRYIPRKCIYRIRVFESIHQYHLKIWLLASRCIWIASRLYLHTRNYCKLEWLKVRNSLFQTWFLVMMIFSHELWKSQFLNKHTIKIMKLFSVISSQSEFLQNEVHT